MNSPNSNWSDSQIQTRIDELEVQRDRKKETITQCRNAIANHKNQSARQIDKLEKRFNRIENESVAAPHFLKAFVLLVVPLGALVAIVGILVSFTKRYRGIGWIFEQGVDWFTVILDFLKERQKKQRKAKREQEKQEAELRTKRRQGTNELDKRKLEKDSVGRKLSYKRDNVRERERELNRQLSEAEDQLRSTKRELTICLDHLKERQKEQRKAKREQDKREAELRAKRRQERDKAHADAYRGNIREQSESVKRKLKKTERCPYCGGLLRADFHGDHIYPVDKGGLSTIENMVNVCKDCNLSKGKLTVRQFCNKRNLDLSEIERRLDQLGKVY